MDWWLAFAIFLYLICAALIVAEVFVPSAGLLSLCALICLGAGVTIFFRHSMVGGWIGLTVGIIMIPSLLVVAYRVLPKTRFGRAVMLAPPSHRQGDAFSDAMELTGLIGRTGIVITPMRPVGRCVIDDRKIECISERGCVGKGDVVRVIGVEGTKVTVRSMET